MHPPHVVRGQACGHRFHALAFPWQQQSLSVVGQRSNTICVPGGLRQAIHVCRKAFLLWAWRYAEKKCATCEQMTSILRIV
jgi:hypothetical protein